MESHPLFSFLLLLRETGGRTKRTGRGFYSLFEDFEGKHCPAGPLWHNGGSAGGISVPSVGTSRIGLSAQLRRSPSKG